jgi:hypothetical protein
MGKKPHLILALLALGFIQPALGQDGSVTFGNRDCGIWLQKDNDYLRMGTEGWLLGYLSGQNKVINTLKKEKNGDVLGKVNSANQILLWMNNYCTANPLSDIATGADKLMVELMKREQ